MLCFFVCTFQALVGYTLLCKIFVLTDLIILLAYFTGEKHLSSLCQCTCSRQSCVCASGPLLHTHTHTHTHTQWHTQTRGTTWLPTPAISTPIFLLSPTPNMLTLKASRRRVAGGWMGKAWWGWGVKRRGSEYWRAWGERERERGRRGGGEGDGREKQKQTNRTDHSC